MQMQEELQGSSFCLELILCSHFPDYSFPKHRKKEQSSTPRLASVPFPLDQTHAACSPAPRATSSAELDGKEDKQQWGGSAGDGISKAPWDPSPQAGAHSKPSPCCAHGRGFGKDFMVGVHLPCAEKGPRPRGAAQGQGAHSPSNIPGTPLSLQHWAAPLSLQQTAAPIPGTGVCIPKGWLWAKGKALAFHTELNIGTLF